MSIARSTLLLTLTNLAVRAGGYVYRIAMARLLSLYEFGVLNLALPLQFLIVVLASSGIAPSVAKFVAERKERVVGSALLYFTAIAFAFALLAALLSPIIASDVFQEAGVAVPFALAALALPLAVAIAVFTGTMQGKKRMGSFAASLLVLQGSRIFFSALLVLISATAAYAIAGSVIGFAVALAVAFALFLKLKVKLHPPDFGEFKELASFSVPVSLTSLGAFALSYIDILALGAILSPSEVGIYGAASPASRLAMAFATALYASVLPSVSELKGEKSRVREVAGYSTRVAFFVLLAVTLLMLAFSEQLILHLFGNAYLGAVEPFRILLIGTFFFGFYTLNSSIFQGMGMPGLPMRILLFAALLDLALNLLLIPPYGIEGAAIATSVSLGLAGVSSSALLWREIWKI